MRAQWQCIQASQYAAVGVVVGGDPNQSTADDQFGAEGKLQPALNPVGSQSPRPWRRTANRGHSSGQAYHS